MPLLFFLELTVTGAVAGITAGFLGVGGGVVLTPLCLMIYPHLGVESDSLIQVIFGTNMVCVTAFSLAAAIQHTATKPIDWRTVALMVPLAVIGSWSGGWTASLISSLYLKKLFGIFLAVSSIIIIVRNAQYTSEGFLKRKALFPMSMIPLLGFIAGFLGTLLGIGGGVVMVPALILLFVYPVERVAAVSSSVIIFIGLAGVCSYMWYGWNKVNLPVLSSGYVWWSSAIPLVLGGVPLARVGAWLNGRIHAKLLEKIFGVFLFLISIKILLT